MLINEMMYKRFKDVIEDKLERYNLYVIALETPGLGTPTNYEIKGSNTPDPVAGSVVDDEYKRILVTAIERVFDSLDDKSKSIIRNYYFEGNIVKPQEIMNELLITKNRYYELKKIALYKFMLGLGYC